MWKILTGVIAEEMYGLLEKGESIARRTEGLLEGKSLNKEATDNQQNNAERM